MIQIRENWPVIETLDGLHYGEMDVIDDARNIYGCKHSHEMVRTCLFAKSGTQSSRHRFGLSLRSLKEVDQVVFWGRWERHLYIIPSKELQLIKEAQNESQVNRGDQWVINIRFDRHELKPVKDVDTHRIVSYAKEIPEDLMRKVSKSNRLPPLNS